MDLIRRADAINAFKKATADGDKVDFCISIINDLPSAQQTGTWKITQEYYNDGKSYFRKSCSECGCVVDLSCDYAYCPDCGSMMSD